MFYASFDTQEEAIRFCTRHCRKRGVKLTIRLLGEWIAYDYRDDEWQGWHYSQIEARTDWLVVTPEGVLTPAQVPVVFEDGNNPGMVYSGDVADQHDLENEGGVSLPVCPGRINNSLVFSPGPNCLTNREDWEMVEIT